MKARTLTTVKIWKAIFFLLTPLLFAGPLRAQVSGTRTIGTDYPSLAAAISDLNTTGALGAVVINVPAGYTETAPAGGYLLGSTVLNAALSSSATLTIQKNGTGSDPLLTASTGTSTSTDGIFIIQGADYVTINGIDVTESSANTTPTTQMEWGYALVKLQNTAPFDGCQHVTIQNCTITLNRANAATVGIYANNHIATATTSLAITAATDAMNNCRFYSNTIQNTVTGISLKGFSSAASPYTLYDQGNDIGGISTATGNTIQNFAGTATGSGINLQYQNNANASYNTINNMAGSGIAATSVIYGIYTQNGTNVSVTASGNVITLTQGAADFNSLYGVNISSSGTGTATINSNQLTANGGASGSVYMVYIGGSNTNIHTDSNRFYNINVATSGSLYMVYHSTAATPAYITCNNNYTDGPATPYVNKTGSGGTVACYYNNAGSGSGTTSFNGNNFSNFNLAGSPTFYGLFENDGGSGQNKTARSNVISNITTAGGTIYGLSIGYSATARFANNQLSFLNAGTGTIYGIYTSFSSSLDSVYNNSVNNLTSTNGNVYGVYIASGTTVSIYQDTVFALATTGTSSSAYGIYQSSGTTANIFRNKIYDLSAAGTSGSVNGMYLNSGTATAYNNLIGDLRTPNYNGAGGTQLAGIYLGSGTAFNIYYNSVYLNAVSTGAAFGSSAIYSSTTPAVTLRNNIFVNTSTANGTGITAAYRRGDASLTTYQAASNNNLFFSGVPGPAKVIFFDGTTPYVTIGDFKSLVTPRDGSSVTENPPFISTTGSSASFLHISTSVPTQIESGAINITGITTDFDSNIRAGNPGYTGTGATPDIGAAEGNYMLTDLSAPDIVFTLLTSGCTTGDRTFTATISDATGVPVSGSLVPRVYFKKGSGAWFSAPGTLVSGTATSGTWSFTVSAATLGGLAVGDVVSYFVIAQDIVSPANIGANPGAGIVATDVNTVTTYPTTPDSYSILPVLSGTYNVGSGGDYATITAAVAAYNTACISGNVIFQLTDAAYTSETFPITINSSASASAANTLTIRPAAGVSPVINGSSTTAVFVLNGADYVTIDGSNSPVTNSICPLVASSRNMTIKNTNTGTSTAVIWLQTTAGGDSATHNIIRNCNVAGSGNSFTLFAIGSGGTSISYTSGGTNNNSNRIENNNITATQTGIFSLGLSASNKNNGTIINQNLMNSVAPDNLRNNGIVTGFENSITISGNMLANITNAVSNDIIGIDLGFGNNAAGTSITTGNDVTNATVTNNKLNNITQTNTYTALGIAVAGVSSGTNLIANNQISGVLSNGTGGDFSSGIFIGGAAGGITNVYYNAVNMSGTVTGASYPTFAICISGTNPIVALKNNLFVNTASTGSTLLYAIGLAYTGYSNLSSDYNDFYTAGPALGAVSGLGGFSTDLADLPAWRTETGNDLHSKNINPTFVSASDLHVAAVTANIPLMNTGIPVSVFTDYDCSARSVTTPDMGINEFDLPTCSSVTAGSAVPATATFCASGSTTITLSGATVGAGINYQWQSSTDSTTFTAIPGATDGTYTTPVISTTTFYRVVLTCSYSGIVDSATTRVTVYPLPVIAVTPDGGGICSGGSGIALVASGAVSYSWSPSTGLSSATGASVTANPAITTTYTVTGTDIHGCNNTHVATVTVTSTPGAFTITPSAATLCVGSPAVLLSATGSALPSAGPVSATTGSISVTVPDATPSGVSVPLSLSSIPAGATVTGVSVNFNINMTFDGDLTINLTAPNGNTLNLVSREGGGGANFTGTQVSSAGGLSFSADVAPFTGIYSADAVTGAGTTSIPVTTTRWSDLYSVGAGTWTLSARDWAGGDVASITSWTITVNYTYVPNVTWAPVTGLFSDVAATIPYTGTSTAAVYAQPAATAIYTATLSLGACTSSASATVTVTAPPHAGVVTGPSSVCNGSSITLTDTVSGGVWSSTNGNASVSVTGVVNGLAVGTDTIRYIVSNACGADTASKIISIDIFPVAGTISGSSVVCEAASVTLSESAAGGIWSSSNSNATVSATGMVTGVTAGTGIITYTVTNGCGSVYATKAITINPSPHAGVILGSFFICPGASTILVDTATGGVWSASNAHATVSPTGIVLGVSTGTDTISYAVSNSCGTAVATAVVTINGGADPGIISGPATVCAGASVFLVETVGGGIWVSSNSHATVTPAGVVTGVSAGIDTIRYDVSGACGIVSATKTITINATPDAGIISGPASVCTGLTIPLSSGMPGGTWSASSAAATVSPTGVVTGVSTGTDIITYTVTNACGSATAIKAVVVDQSPNAFTVTGGGAFCLGGPGVAIGLSGSQSGVSYQLFNGASPVGAPVAGTGSPLNFGLHTASGSYTVAATNAAGCVVTMTGAATVIVNPTVPPTVSIASSATATCTGSPVTLTAIPVNGGATPTYQWRVNGAARATGDTFTYIPANGDIVSVTITSSSCASPDTASDATTITVTSSVLPSVTITVSPNDTVCSGTEVIFTATPAFGGPSPFFRWTKNGVNVATGPMYTYIPSNGDNVYCLLGSDYQCRSADSALSNHIIMDVVPYTPPSVVITARPGTSISAGQADTFMATVLNAGTTPGYQWFINGVAVRGATASLFTHRGFTSGDSVSCTIISSGICGGTAAHAFVIVTVGNVGVNTVTGNAMNIALLPNPNKGTFQLKGAVIDPDDDAIPFEVINMLGQVVYSANAKAVNGVINEQVVLNNKLANGMYTLSLHSANGNMVFHFVLEQ